MAGPASPKLGWRKVKLRDDVPICALAGYEAFDKAQFLKDVTKQRLRAKSPVLFAAYAAWCITEACDSLPSLQCDVALEGNTLTIHSDYWGEYKDEGACPRDACHPVVAACKTPALERGRYKVKYGDETFDLRIPGLLRSPCFGTEKRRRAGPEPAQATAPVHIPTEPAPVARPPAPPPARGKPQ